MPASNAIRRRVLPGLPLSLGITLFYVGLIVLLPLGALVFKAASLGPEDYWRVVSSARAVASYRVTVLSAAAATAFNLVFGLALAWVLVRYSFPGKRLVDAIVDLPFALPTAVAGIALASLYAPNGLVGAQLARIGIEAAYTPVGIFIAMVFIGLPFAVRTVQPLIGEIDKEVEEASAILGASRVATLTKVVLPPLIPAVLTGFALAFARGVGEYGSIIFIAGNLPYVSEIAPLLIVIKLSEFDYQGASAIAVIMLAISFLTLLAINLIQAWSRRRFGYV